MTKIKVRNILFNIFAIVTVIAVLFVSINLITGTKGYAVTSNSMADSFNRGDIVFSRKVNFDELKTGDVVTVKVNDSGYFTHRIVDINSEKQMVTTKGDANSSVDPMPTKADMIVGRMVYTIPFLGYISMLFGNGSQTMILLIVLVITAAILIAVNTIASRKQNMRGDSNE